MAPSGRAATLSGGMSALAESLRQFLSTPARQAIALVSLGALGLMLGAGGITLLASGGDGGDGALPATVADPTPTKAAASATAAVSPTRRATARPSPTRTATSTPTMTPTPGDAEPTPTPAPAVLDSSADAPTPPPVQVEPTPTATPEPVVSTGQYCDTISATAPPTTTVAGNLTVGGLPAPFDTSVHISFDGVVGPTALVVVEGARTGYSAAFSLGPESCANILGASIAVVVNGVSHRTGHVVSTEMPFIRFDIAQ